MKLLLTLLTLIPLTLFCQNPATPKKVEFSIGLTFSPDYCYRTLKTDGSIAIYKWAAESRDTFEIPKFGYTTGLNFAVKFNKRFSLETGLLFSDKGEKTKRLSDLHAIKPDSTMPTAVTFIYRYIYIDIPIKVNFYILTKRAKLFVMAGISPNIFLSQKTTSIIEYRDGHKNTDNSWHHEGYTIIDLTVIAGLGFSYDLSNKLSFSLEPTYRRSITPINDGGIRSYLYSIGLTTGLYYKL
ncbi:MAG TPA: outer membrane beta-barrel protein [Bacteroidales bacterium]|nr:outer membrane beta-barrel protein [Bacteroidales bacterium]